MITKKDLSHTVAIVQISVCSYRDLLVPVHGIPVWSMDEENQLMPWIFGMHQSNCSWYCKRLQIEFGSDSFDVVDGLRRGDATKNTPMRLERMKHMQHQQALSWIYR